MKFYEQVLLVETQNKNFNFYFNNEWKRISFGVLSFMVLELSSKWKRCAMTHLRPTIDVIKYFVFSSLLLLPFTVRYCSSIRTKGPGGLGYILVMFVMQRKLNKENKTFAKIKWKKKYYKNLLIHTKKLLCLGLTDIGITNQQHVFNKIERLIINGVRVAYVCLWFHNF